MDAITLLKTDHKKVKALFAKIDKTGERATQQLGKLAREVITELSIHAAIEEQLFYPAARELCSDCDDEVLESLEEHHIVKWVLSELDGMQPTDERYRAKLTVLKENVLHHAEEEEQDLFPKVRAAAGRTLLRDLGEQMAKMKKTAPTHPHPRTPDSPPFNMVAGAVAGLADRARDKGEAALRRTRAKATGSTRRRTSSTATTAESAKSSGRRATSTAKSSARRAATTAKSATRRATSTSRGTPSRSRSRTRTSS